VKRRVLKCRYVLGPFDVSSLYPLCLCDLITLTCFLASRKSQHSSCPPFPLAELSPRLQPRYPNTPYFPSRNKFPTVNPLFSETFPFLAFRGLSEWKCPFLRVLLPSFRSDPLFPPGNRFLRSAPLGRRRCMASLSSIAAERFQYLSGHDFFRLILDPPHTSLPLSPRLL